MMREELEECTLQLQTDLSGVWAFKCRCCCEAASCTLTCCTCSWSSCQYSTCHIITVHFQGRTRTGTRRDSEIRTTSEIMSKSTLHDQILQLEERTWQALQKSGRALTPFLTKDAIMQFPLGVKVTANSQPSLTDILHSPGYLPWKTYSLKNVDVTSIGTDGAVISYLAKATRATVESEGGDDVEWEALCSSVWRKEGDGNFYMCFHQQTLTT